MEGKFQDHNMIHFKKFNDNESRGKGPEIYFFELSKFWDIKDSEGSCLSDTFSLIGDRWWGAVTTLMDVLIWEAGFWVLNISCQLSTVASLSPSVHCFSVKREWTSDASVCRHWYTPRNVVCGKVTVTCNRND